MSYVAAVSGAVAEFAAVGAAAAQQVFSRAGALCEQGGGVGGQQRQGGAGVGGICRADVEAAQVPNGGADVAIVVFCRPDRDAAVRAKAIHFRSTRIVGCQCAEIFFIGPVFAIPDGGTIVTFVIVRPSADHRAVAVGSPYEGMT